MMTNRRDFLRYSLASTLMTCSSFAGCSRSPRDEQALVPSAASAQRLGALANAAVNANQREVVIAGATGAFGQFTKKMFYDPFTAATGIKVTAVPVGQGERLAKAVAQCDALITTAAVPAGHVSLHVEDSGPGVPAAQQQGLFESTSASGRFRLGLGLNVCRELIELHGGTVEAHSEGLGKGATFTITLPLADSMPAAAAIRTATTKSLQAALKKGTVYIQNGAEVVTLEPESSVSMQVEAKSKKDKQSIKIELSWERAEDEVEAANGTLSISETEPDLVGVIDED